MCCSCFTAGKFCICFTTPLTLLQIYKMGLERNTVYLCGVSFFSFLREAIRVSVNGADFSGWDHGELLFVWSYKIKTQIFKFILFSPHGSALFYIGSVHNFHMAARYCENNGQYWEQVKRNARHRNVYTQNHSNTYCVSVYI